MRTALSPCPPFGLADYELFQTRVEAKFGIRLKDYKIEQMQRRLGTIARRSDTHSFQDYFARLERDHVSLQTFRNEVTINVTEFLRNPRLFEQFSRDILPGLMCQKRALPLAVWSAGCSYGAEAYSMALILHEADSQACFRVQGTDVDRQVIAQANAALFTEADLRNVDAERRETHFAPVQGKGFQPSPSLRRNVSFAKHDLLTDAYPQEVYDVICCRNVVIYFTEEAKDRVFRGFFSALRPGGVLFVGGSERLANYAQIGFEMICPFFFRKPF